MKPEVNSLTSTEVIQLENVLESKFSMIYKSFGIMSLIMIVAFFYQILRGRETHIGIFLIVGIIFYTPFFCILWFGYIAKIKKDLNELKKVKFKAKIIDKVHDNVLGIDECLLLLEDNEAGISKINVEKEIFDKIPLFSHVLVSVAMHSKSYISCEILS
jgi:hypothetical protein